MPRALLLALLLTLAAAAPAHAATRHVVRGAGYGHGIGMSQYGALGFAQQGRGYAEILGHYYRGTRLGRADTQIIRVLLQSGAGRASFTSATAAGSEVLDPAETYRARPYGAAEVEVRGPGNQLVGRFPAPLEIRGSDVPVRLLGRALNGVDGGTYRGALELRQSTFQRGMTVVNAASLDEYVQGVVPGEVPPAWPAEALKAQAVAARSYALTTDRGGEVFDQYPDTRSQVYRGVVSEQPTTNAAVQATAGEVLRYGEQVAVTFFFSTSGGRTENVENVFYGSPPRPYLVSVEDPFDGGAPRHRWRLSFTQGQMQAKLKGLVKGRFRRIRVLRRGASPRVVDAYVVGTRGRTRVRGATLRTKLGLYDTWAYFSTISSRRAVAASRRSWLSRVVGPREIEAVISPAPRGGVTVERLRGRAWAPIGRLATRRGGRYRFGVRRAGRYRVLVDGAPGPNVRVP